MKKTCRYMFGLIIYLFGFFLFPIDSVGDMSFKFNIMILIADSGATKTDWCALDKKGAGKLIYFKSEAYNPNYIGGPDIVKSIGAAVPQNFPADEVEEIDFYGAGVTELQYGFMKECMVKVFPNAKVNMAMDLLGSARALLQHEPGFAAILGTGTPCIYDGKKVTMNIDSLGFILGDEGSGAYLARDLFVILSVEICQKRLAKSSRNIVL